MPKRGLGCGLERHDHQRGGAVIAKRRLVEQSVPTVSESFSDARKLIVPPTIASVDTTL